MNIWFTATALVWSLWNRSKQLLQRSSDNRSGFNIHILYRVAVDITTIKVIFPFLRIEDGGNDTIKPRFFVCFRLRWKKYPPRRINNHREGKSNFGGWTLKLGLRGLIYLFICSSRHRIRWDSFIVSRMFLRPPSLIVHNL